MSTLAEVKAVVPQLSVDELEELEQVVRIARQEKERANKPSVLDREPLNLGRMLRPLALVRNGTRILRERCEHG